MKKIISIIFISLFATSLVAQNFQTHILTQNTTNAVLSPTISVVGDIDGDGDNDIITNSYEQQTIVKYLNDGNGNYGDAIIIDRTSKITAMELADFDGDGDLDICVVFDGRARKIVWFPNYGNGTFAPFNHIDEASFYIKKIKIVDIDNDGDLDFCTIDLVEDEVSCYINNGYGHFIDKKVTSMLSTSTATLGDVNGDGYPDLIYLWSLYDKIIIKLNDGHGRFYSSTPSIDVPEYYSKPVEVIDIDNDGDLDILFGSRTQIQWVENNGNGNFSTIHHLANSASIQEFNIIDFDNDGDYDFIAIGYSIVKYYENTNNGTNFIPHTIVDNMRLASVSIADINNDNIPDVSFVRTITNLVGWIGNNGNGNFGNINRVSANGHHSCNVAIGDINGNGSNNVLAGFYDQGKLSEFTSLTQSPVENIIDTSLNISKIELVDLDNDNDLDILYARSSGDKLGWLKNNNGTYQNNFLPVNSYSDSKDFTYADIDNDGDMDILATGYANITLFLNDGSGNFSISYDNHVSIYSNEFLSPQLIDIDGDSDLDIVAIQTGYGKLVYIRNNGYSGFSTNRPYELINTYFPKIDIDTGDVDGDGDLDIVSAEEPRIKVYLNPNTYRGDFTPVYLEEHLIFQTVKFVDFDNDGDLDVLAGSKYTPVLSWYENDGTGNFGTQQVIDDTSTDPVDEFTVVDFDGDGDIDIFTTNTLKGKITYYDNLSITAPMSIENDSDNESYKVYPNPTTNYIQITPLGNQTVKTITISNMTGTTIRVIDNPKENLIIDLADFSSGIYIISIIDSSNQKSVQKIIKK